jgi:hypothetical protein
MLVIGDLSLHIVPRNKERQRCLHPDTIHKASPGCTHDLGGGETVSIKNNFLVVGSEVLEFTRNVGAQLNVGHCCKLLTQVFNGGATFEMQMDSV